MSWHGIGDFLHMGGYGLYVWGSYGVTLGALAVELLILVRRERSLRRLRAPGLGARPR
ncbi:MAG TPA: heme exporter protein CcmD [Burkholderiales bacterium]|nr:heme exporter protein CcmD [Burkholderiales bacterium]